MPSPSIVPNNFLPGLHINRLNQKWLLSTYQILQFDPRCAVLYRSKTSVIQFKFMKCMNAPSEKF